MRHRILLLAAFMALTTHVSAERFFGDVGIQARLGYNIGGTTPIGMPATIRSLNKYTLQPNLQIGVDVTKPISGRWDLIAGLHFENKGMKIDANVKNYSMEITRGDQTLGGRFTGNVVSKARLWMLTVPLMGAYNISQKVKVKAGPYLSYVVSGGFDGYAYDGYLRVDDPTGAKVELGNTEDTRGSYDFAEQLRHAQVGIVVGADWQVGNRLGAFAELNWGLTGIHHSQFKTIEQTLYPIFGTIGMNFKLK